MNPILATIKAHIPATIVILALLIGGHSWLVEHDNRLLAEQTVKVAEVQVKDLQAQIVSVNQAAAQKVQTVTKVVKDVKTPAEVITALPQITDAPLNTRAAIDSPNQVSVDALPLLSALAGGRVDRIKLEACTATSSGLQEIVKAKDTEITALKKPRSFWKRLSGTLKTVGIGVGIGAVIGARL